MTLGKFQPARIPLLLLFLLLLSLVLWLRRGGRNKLGQSLQCYLQIIRIFAQALYVGCHKALPVQSCSLGMEGWGFHMKQAGWEIPLLGSSFISLDFSTILVASGDAAPKLCIQGPSSCTLTPRHASCLRALVAAIYCLFRYSHKAVIKIVEFCTIKLHV